MCEMTSILFDMNNLAVRTYCTKGVGFDTDTPDIQHWKHIIIDSIYKSMGYVDTKEVVLAIDDKKSWRKLYWNRYKESRKGKRDKSKINWDVFHSEYKNFTDEIQEHLPFKVLLVENAEADDIIGIMCLKDEGEYQIISNDEDYLQLVSDRIKLYNPNKARFMECENTERFLIEKCLTGQSKDDIFNILTPLDWPSGKRKPGFGEVSANKVIDAGYQEWLSENKLEERFEVNRTLIDFQRIPKVIRTRILNAYNNYQLADPSKMYEFFKNNKFNDYLEDFSSVESKLLQLY